jgi:hypothetical protein
MGGGGGWYRAGRGPAILAQLQDRAQSTTDEAAYEVAVESILRDALVGFNDRDVEGIGQHLQTIEQSLSQEMEGTVQLRFGGSVSKHTYVNGLSDVDMLVCLNDSTLANESPGKVMDYFEQRLRQRLPRTVIKRGVLAVTVAFSDGHEVQLLPALKTSSGYRIASPDGNAWSNVVAPARFASKLTDVHRAQQGKVVPVIRLYKVLNKTLPKPVRLSGYHIESLAIESFQTYHGRQALKPMLIHFCTEAKHRVLEPIVDRTGQSRHVDDRLGASNSPERQRAARAIHNLLSKLTNADGLRDSDTWKEMFSL